MSQKRDHSNTYLSRCTLLGHPQLGLSYHQWYSVRVEQTNKGIKSTSDLADCLIFSTKICSTAPLILVSKFAIKEAGFRGAKMKGQWVRVRVRVG